MWMHATIMVMVKRRGFTIVELMVVILAIAILARIVFVGYNGVQARSRDTIRKNDIVSLSKQMQIYAIQKKTWNGMCGDATSTMSGYTNVDYDGAGVGNDTITGCLKTFDETNKQLNDPSGCMSMAAEFAVDQSPKCKTNIRSAYKAYNTGSHYFLVTKLETETGQLAAYTDADLTAAGIKPAMQTAGFNYILKVR